MNIFQITKELEMLKMGYDITISKYYDWIVFSNFVTPPGYNYSVIPVAIKLGSDYPLTPTLIEHGGYGIHTRGELVFNGRKIKSHYSRVEKGWYYWCFSRIDWDPYRDNINTLLELFRITLSNPPLS